MTDSLFPSVEGMASAGSFFATFVAWGIGLSVVFWAIGLLVWFIVQFFR